MWGVNTAPEALSLEKFQRRREEAENFIERIRNELDFDRLVGIRQIIKEIEEQKVVSVPINSISL